jgi:DNA polymerase III alpha subunit
MKDLIKRLQPDCFEDMIALVALFRPGPSWAICMTCSWYRMMP